MKPIPNETELHVQYQKETGKSRPFDCNPYYPYSFEYDMEVKLSDEEMSDIIEFGHIHNQAYRTINRTESIPLPQEIANYIEWLESKINSK
jgi:hypothetical protein